MTQDERQKTMRFTILASGAALVGVVVLSAVVLLLVRSGEEEPKPPVLAQAPSPTETAVPNAAPALTPVPQPPPPPAPTSTPRPTTMVLPTATPTIGSVKSTPVATIGPAAAGTNPVNFLGQPFQAARIAFLVDASPNWGVTKDHLAIMANLAERTLKSLPPETKCFLAQSVDYKKEGDQLWVLKDQPLTAQTMETVPGKILALEGQTTHLITFGNRLANTSQMGTAQTPLALIGMTANLEKSRLQHIANLKYLRKKEDGLAFCLILNISDKPVEEETVNELAAKGIILLTRSLNELKK